MTTKSWTIRNITSKDFGGGLSSTSLEKFHNYFINESPKSWLPQDIYYLYDADLCIGNKGGDGDGYWKNEIPRYINGKYYMPMGEIVMIKFINNQWVKYHPSIGEDDEEIYDRFTPDTLQKRKKGFFEKLLNGE